MTLRTRFKLNRLELIERVYYARKGLKKYWDEQEEIKKHIKKHGGRYSYKIFYNITGSYEGKIIEHRKPNLDPKYWAIRQKELIDIEDRFEFHKPKNMIHTIDYYYNKWSNKNQVYPKRRAY